MKGIIYIMTTVVSGLIKIGQTRADNFHERMRFMEANGYYNISGLKRFFAIELKDYIDKEKLLKEIFSKHRVGDGELFALDCDMVRQLLLSFEGKVVYPQNIDREKEFDKVVKTRKQSARFSFYKKGIKNGAKIVFAEDNNIVAKVVGEREVEYGKQIWKLSPLTYFLYQQKGKLTKSGTYQGAAHWQYQGERLTALPNIK